MADDSSILASHILPSDSNDGHSIHNRLYGTWVGFFLDCGMAKLDRGRMDNNRPYRSNIWDCYFLSNTA